MGTEGRRKRETQTTIMDGLLAKPGVTRGRTVVSNERGITTDRGERGRRGKFKSLARVIVKTGSRREVAGSRLICFGIFGKRGEG